MQQQEVEAEPEVEEVRKKKYSTKAQQPTGWDFRGLTRPVGSGALPCFYPLGTFSIYKDSFFYNSGKPLDFPPDILVSENYYHKLWTLTAHRRLKNVILWLDWTPDTTACKLVTPKQARPLQVAPLTPEQEKKLARAFAMFNVSRSGDLASPCPSELHEVLRAVDVPVESASELGALLPSLLDPLSGKMDLAQWIKLMSEQGFHRLHSQRYSVALSLAEAETLRGIMHTDEVHQLLAATHTTLGLRCGSLLFDSTRGYESPPPAQLITSESNLKLFNSELYFSEREIGTLLRTLQCNPMDRREGFFEEVKSCRRRRQKEWQQTALSTLFLQPDYYGLVEFRSIMAAVRARIASRQMRLLDAFRAFDYNRDGRLSCSEFAGGLEWLGMHDLAVEDIHAIVRYVDKTGVGYILFEHFQQAFRKPQELVDLEEGALANGIDLPPAEFVDPILAATENAAALSTAASLAAASGGYPSGATSSSTDFRTLVIEPKPMRELFASDESDTGTRVEEVPASALAQLEVRVRKVTAWHHSVWNSKQILSRKEASVWQAIGHSSFLARNKVAISVGHYAAAGQSQSRTKPPSSLHGLMLELTDLDCSSLFRSKFLEVARLNFMLPHPVNFKLAWSTQRADGSGVWFWRPVPPTPHFVALGMIATTSVEQPKLTDVRCVPKGQQTSRNSSHSRLTRSVEKSGEFEFVSHLSLLLVLSPCCSVLGWTCVSKVSPQLLWDDSGSTGRKGSLWQVGSLGLLHATDSHEIASSEVFLDLLPAPIAASHGFVANTAAASSSSQPVTNAKDIAVNAQPGPKK